MSRRHKKKTTSSKLTKEAAIAEREKNRFQSFAEAEGFTFRESLISVGPFGRKKVQHWMLDMDGERILDFWPTTKTWRSPIIEKSGRAMNATHAVEIACCAIDELIDERSVQRSGSKVSATTPLPTADLPAAICAKKARDPGADLEYGSRATIA